MTRVYVLCMATDDGTGKDSDWDVFGIYSTFLDAECARKWRRMEDGRYLGCSIKHVYTRAFIVTRIVDHNLPEEMKKEASLTYMGALANDLLDNTRARAQK